MLYWLIINLIFISIYLIIISLLFNGWNRLKEFQSIAVVNCKTKISVIVALRNEEENVEQLVQSLLNQDTSNIEVEFILVDDQSTDNTLYLLQSLTGTNPFFKLLPGNGQSGKKNAILSGINYSTGNLIVTTDADCIHHELWLKTIYNYYCSYRPKMIIGPVLMKNDSFFEKIQALDFFSLMISGAGSAGIKNPMMCNGANLVYEKSLLDGLLDPLTTETASGDDMFLMLAAKEKYPQDIHFLKSQQAVVITKPEIDFLSFMAQRQRWASKSRYYKDKYLIIVAFSVFFTNLLLIVNFFAGFADKHLFLLFTALSFIKALIDFIFLFHSTKYFNQSQLIKIFFPALVLNILYIPVTAIIGLFVSIKWKGRKIIP